jgi:subtilisin family serine protease
MLTQTRPKPDICAVDGVAVTGAGGFYNPFYGTSAAAPHVAAIAALGWSKNPTWTADQVKAKLLEGTIDLGQSGYDSVYGNGRADVMAAFGVVTYGDVNGDASINITDAVLVLKYITDPSLGINILVADVNGDSDINITDAVLILKHITSPGEPFPVEMN